MKLQLSNLVYLIRSVLHMMSVFSFLPCKQLLKKRDKIPIINLNYDKQIKFTLSLIQKFCKKWIQIFSNFSFFSFPSPHSLWPLYHAATIQSVGPTSIVPIHELSLMSEILLVELFPIWKALSTVKIWAKKHIDNRCRLWDKNIITDNIADIRLSVIY